MRLCLIILSIIACLMPWRLGLGHALSPALSDGLIHKVPFAVRPRTAQ